jgi:hypothetical protein
LGVAFVVVILVLVAVIVYSAVAHQRQQCPSGEVHHREHGTARETASCETWYTIDGMKLDGKPTKKGVYIMNGKKVKR